MDKFSEVSATAKSIAVVVVGVLVAVGGKLAGGGVAIAVVGCGLIGLGLVLLIVAQVIQFVVYRQSERFGKGLQRDVSDKFRQGWQRLAKAGKDRDPYFLPWYIMVGEPGAGKTQAIKHSHIKFVPGFNDPATGEGGTLAMDWWFADKAILLDTAGALLMDTARTEEFQEFLHRIRQHRPKLPINGLILAIPANALQTDTIQEIQAKSAVIAQQLDLVQRELGVRFPVYVIITKADLISGFRDFFDNISDPTVPNQILGWSNPAGLDGTFDPGEVEAHLQSVGAALRRRRMGLLLDPAGDDPSASRIDKTDALFAFPEQLAQTGLRLRTYLENVFTPSEWTQAPLFLRGIYFTSSMREGPPLDLDLARSFNISPKDLPAEVRVWEREKACFLRDLFVEKIFREKGLVTTSTEVDRRVRRRQHTVLAIGAAAVVAVLAFTLFGYVQLKQSVGEHYDFWSAVTRYDPGHPASAASLDWLGQTPDTPLSDLGIHYGDATTLADIYAANVRLAQKDLKTPWIFVFAQELGGDVNAQRAAAHRLLFEQGVSNAAWAWLMEQRPWGSDLAWPWDNQIPAAQRKAEAPQLSAADAAGGHVLAQLILMDTGVVSREESDSPPPEEMARLKDLLDAAGWPDDASTVRTFRNSWLWFATHGAMKDKIDGASAKWAHACADWMIAYYDAAFSQAMQTRRNLLAAISDYDQKEQAFLDSAKGAVEASDIQKIWTSPQAADLISAGGKLNDALAALAQSPGQGGDQTFAQLYDGGGATAGAAAMSELIDAIGPSGAAADIVQELTTARDTLRKRLVDESAAPREQVKQLAAWGDNRLGDWETWPYATRWMAYRAVAGAWSGAPAKGGSLSDALAGAAGLLNIPDFGAADRGGANAICHKALAAAASARAYLAWDAALSADALILNQQGGAGAPVKLTPIPFATVTHPPAGAFDPKTAKTLFARMQERQKLWSNPPVAPANAAALAARLQQNQALLGQYEKAYTDAWTRALALRVLVPPDFSPTDIDGATEQLKQLGAQVSDALSVVPPDARVSAALDSIHTAMSAPADLEGLVKRLLGDWKVVQLNLQAARGDSHWRDELSFLLNASSSNFISDYWKGVAQAVAISFDLLDKNPSVEVSIPDPQDQYAPGDAAGALNQLRGQYPYILIGTGSPMPLTANSAQTIKFNDGLDVRLLGSNNVNDTKDTAGDASEKEVLSLLMDSKNVQSAADANTWYVHLVSQQGNTLWLKLKLGADAPRMPVQN